MDLRYSDADSSQRMLNAIGSALTRLVDEMDTNQFISMGKIKPSQRLSQYVCSHFWN